MQHSLHFRVLVQIVEDTINIGAQTGVTLKGQTEQMGRIVNDLDTIHFSIKKAANLLKEISRQVSPCPSQVQLNDSCSDGHLAARLSPL